MEKKQKKYIIIILPLCLVFLVCLALRWRLHLVPAFLASSQTGNILDTRFWYSVSEGYSILAGFSADSFRIYHEILIWDMILPFVYCFLVLQAISFSGINYKFLKILPIAAMAFDYIENVFTFSVMTAYPQEIDPLMFMANIAGTIKYCCQYVSWVLLVLGLIVGLIRRFGAKVSADT